MKYDLIILMTKYFKELSGSFQNRVSHLFVLLAALGILGFLLISNTFDFRDNLFSKLFPKPSSKALEADQTFTMSDSNTGAPLDCTGTVCTTTANSVNIKIDDSQIQSLLNELP